GDAGGAWVPLFLLPGGPNRALYPFVHVLLRDRGRFAGGYGVLVDTGATTSMLDRDKIDYQREHHPAWGTANGAAGDADMLAGAWPEAMLRVDDVALDAPLVALRSLGLTEQPFIEVGPALFVD